MSLIQIFTLNLTRENKSVFFSSLSICLCLSVCLCVFVQMFTQLVSSTHTQQRSNGGSLHAKSEYCRWFSVFYSRKLYPQSERSLYKSLNLFSLYIFQYIIAIILIIVTNVVLLSLYCLVSIFSIFSLSYFTNINTEQRRRIQESCSIWLFRVV